MSEWMKYGVRRRDTAEAGVIAALREAGATVLQLTGRDVPDLLVGFAGQTHAVEVKTNQAKLKPGQARLASEWKGSPIEVARTPAQARKLLALWRDRRPTLGTVLRAEHEARRVKGIPFDEVLERQLRDPEFRKHYEAARAEHEARESVKAGPWQGPEET